MADRCSEQAWCAPMAAALNDHGAFAGMPGGDGKGLTAVYGWRGEEPKGTAPLPFEVVYRKRARERGVPLILCPWCGERIRFWIGVEAEESAERLGVSLEMSPSMPTHSFVGRTKP